MVWRDALKKHADRWAVETASSGTQALARFAAAPFDLVVTDLKMPQMDGCQLTEAIRLLDRDVPIIWITAFPEPDSEAKARSLAVYCCLNKPVSVSQIRQTVSDVLDPKLSPN